MSKLRPKQILREIGKSYPQAWAQVKSMRGDKGKALPDWPGWCYLPIAGGVAIATQGDDNRLTDVAFRTRLSPAVITAAAAWRVSQGVYKFDADLYNALVSQALDGNLPCDVLKRLPEWCVYIETIKATFCGVPIMGFWAHLEKDMNDGREELRFVLMCKSGDNQPASVHLGDWTLEEGLDRMQQEANRQGEIHKIHPYLTSFPVVDFVKDVAPLLQLVLYLCAENMDVPETPVHPNTRVHMSGDVPREPRFWTVGERIGAAIRTHRNQEAQQEAGGTTHASPRPHVRRAHWHSFWTGPRDGERKLILRWLPPIPIGVEQEDGPVVIHEVK